MIKKFSGEEWFGINEEASQAVNESENFRAGSHQREMQDRLKARRAKKKDKEEKEDKGESQQDRDAAHRRRMRNQHAGLGEAASVNKEGCDEGPGKVRYTPEMKIEDLQVEVKMLTDRVEELEKLVKAIGGGYPPSGGGSSGLRGLSR